MKFRKKPVVIEAVQFKGDSAGCEAVLAFIGGPDPEKILWKTCTYDGGFVLTLEGRMEFKPGDWIIRGIKSELYPCKPDIFEQTYEKITE